MKFKDVKILKKHITALVNMDALGQVLSSTITGNGLIVTFGEKKKVKKIFSTIVFLLILVSSSAHPWKPRHYVIIDTDGGLDDQKAICMLLASPDVRVLAVTASGGFNNADVAYSNIRSLLDALWHEGLPVAKGDEAAALIENILGEESTPVIFIALGSLKIVADALEDSPSFTKKVRQIIWSNSGLPGKDGLNYRVAPAEADKVLTCELPVIVTGSDGEGFYNEALLSEIGDLDSPDALMIMSIIKERASHPFVFTAFDEMVPLLLHFPALFKTTDSDQKNKFYSPADIAGLRKSAIKMLKGETVQKMQAIKSLPADTAFYMKDIQPYVTGIRGKYGEDEWASGVIANELHRHLGVFAIIGVKMGIRAREYFNAGVDEMSVVSHAGSTPPLSCMNDGVQVSTGATPGHGLLTVSSATPAFAAADFTYKETTIRISLNKDLAEKVSSELKEINFVHGLDSDVYWELVRQNSIKYWLQFDRHEIFDIEIIK